MRIFVILIFVLFACDYNEIQPIDDYDYNKPKFYYFDSAKIYVDSLKTEILPIILPKEVKIYD